MAAFVQPAFVFGAFVETKSLKELRQQSEHAGGGAGRVLKPVWVT